MALNFDRFGASYTDQSATSGGALKPIDRLTLVALNKGQITPTELDAGELAKQTVTLQGAARTSLAKAQDGTEGGALLIGSRSPDIITGSTGSDLIAAGDGDDKVFRTDGGEGFDFYLLADGNDEYFFLKEAGATGPKGEAVIFAGKGRDVADYEHVNKDEIVFRIQQFAPTLPQQAIVAEVLNSATGEIQATDTLYEFEEIRSDLADDKLIVNELTTAKIRQLRETLEKIDFDKNQIKGDTIEFSPEQPGGGQAAQQAVQPSGDDGDGDTADDAFPHGVVVDLRNTDDQFVAKYDGDISNIEGIAYEAGLGIGNISILHDILEVFGATGNKLDLDNYKKDERLDLKNAESASGTNHKDIILGPRYEGVDKEFAQQINVELGQEDDVQYSSYATGDVKGEEGDDLLYAWRPQSINVGEAYDPSNSESATAEEDERLVVDAGEGDDILFALSGTGAQLVGGEGRDFLFNTSYAGELYGDTIDGVGQSTTGTTDSDVFWFWPGTFIKDAQPNDILQIFGFPLLGGTNAALGAIQVGDGGLAQDFLNWFTFYGFTDGDQLLVYNALADVIINRPGDDRPDTLLSRVQVVENYDFGGFASEQFGIPEAGDLGLTFRIYREDGIEISLFNAVWGHLISLVEAIANLAKLVRWQPVDVPLVLDLDGDGIETVSQLHSSVYFDHNGDYFAEASGWLGADDGFLVVARDAADALGGGLIDSALKQGIGEGANDNHAPPVQQAA